MQDLDLLSKELKDKILSDDSKLDEATKELKNQIENDLEGDFKMEKFQELRQDRKAIMTGAVTAAQKEVNEVNQLYAEVEDREAEPEFKKNRRRDTIDNEDYNQLKKLVEKYRFLYTHFAGMFYAENRFNDKVSSVVDLQQSRRLQQQNLEVVTDNIPTIIENSFQEHSRYSELERKLEEKEEQIQELKEDSGDERVDDLKERIDRLERKIESQGRRSQGTNKSQSQTAPNGIRTDKSTGKKEQIEKKAESEEETQQDLETVDISVLPEEVDLTDLQEEVTRIIDEDDVEDLEELAEELGRPKIAVKSVVTGMKNKAEDEGLKSEELGFVVG